jgi:predicted PurR-regulated permease PerM
MNKYCIILILIFLISPIIVNSQELEKSIDELRNTMISENIKTRSEIKNYCDGKVDFLMNNFEVKGQEFIDNNVRVFDARINSLANKIFIKMVVGIVASILFACSLWYLIRRRVNSLERNKVG